MHACVLVSVRSNKRISSSNSIKHLLALHILYEGDCLRTVEKRTQNQRTTWIRDQGPLIPKTLPLPLLNQVMYQQIRNSKNPRFNTFNETLVRSWDRHPRRSKIHEVDKLLYTNPQLIENFGSIYLLSMTETERSTKLSRMLSYYTLVLTNTSTTTMRRR